MQQTPSSKFPSQGSPTISIQVKEGAPINLQTFFEPEIDVTLMKKLGLPFPKTIPPSPITNDLPNRKRCVLSEEEEVYGIDFGLMAKLNLPFPKRCRKEQNHTAFHGITPSSPLNAMAKNESLDTGCPKMEIRETAFAKRTRYDVEGEEGGGIDYNLLAKLGLPFPKRYKKDLRNTGCRRSPRPKVPENHLRKEESHASNSDVVKSKVSAVAENHKISVPEPSILAMSKAQIAKDRATANYKKKLELLVDKDKKKPV